MTEIQWPADKVERRAVADLVPYARNARTHSDEQVGQIAASIKEWGWTVPVLVDEDGGIIAGHGRILAAQKLGIADVPCMVAEGWTEAQKRAYVLADNKLTLNGGWNDELLKLELQDLDAMGVGLELIGFGVDEMAVLFDGPSVEDGFDDVNEEDVEQGGSVIAVGPYRSLVDYAPLQDLLNDLRAEAEDDPEEVKKLILHRLGFQQ